MPSTHENKDTGDNSVVFVDIQHRKHSKPSDEYFPDITSKKFY